jgi:hypothetical protein
METAGFLVFFFVVVSIALGLHSVRTDSNDAAAPRLLIDGILDVDQ